MLPCPGPMKAMKMRPAWKVQLPKGVKAAAKERNEKEILRTCTVR